MNVWLTGAGGMLGTDVAKQLRAWRVPHRGTGREVDVSDADAVQSFAAKSPFTHIINCAAYTQVDQAETEEATAQRVNGDALGILGRQATAMGATVVHFSTDYVFAGDNPQPYSEDAPIRPLSVYGRSKRSGEQQLEESCVQPYILRTSWLFGANGPSFVSTMLRLMTARPALGVVADQFGRPTATTDLRDAALALAGIGPQSREPAPFGTYHFANHPHTTWHGFAQAIRHEAARQGVVLTVQQINAITTADYPTPAARPKHAIFDTTKIEAALQTPCPDWSPALSQIIQAIGQGAS
ncbi:MAG: dTDP-4-dehydrorhamnose reductase [Rhodobacterales bacterium]|nr:dTDP-4-dehydrorhamnose reductase [Rhodobacterales bacterium]